MARKLYKFRWEMRRSADIVSIFVATPEEIEKAIGSEVNFGEIAGKHSEVQGTLTQENVTVLTEDEQFITQAESLGVIPVGHNPLKYITYRCEDCDEQIDESDEKCSYCAEQKKDE